MADQRSLSREATSLLEALSRDQLFEITHRAVVDWFEGLSRQLLGPSSRGCRFGTGLWPIRWAQRRTCLPHRPSGRPPPRQSDK